MESIRCGTCRKLLAKGQYQQLEIKCPRCGTINHLKANKEPHIRTPGASSRESKIHDTEEDGRR